MKKLLLFSFCLVSFFGKAQVTIVEETMENANKEVGYELLPKSNLMIITKDKPMGGLVVASFINNISSYDIDGNKKVFCNDKKLYGTTFSNSEKVILTTNTSSGMFNYFIDGKPIELSKSDFKDIRAAYNYNSLNFTSKYEYSLKNRKDDFHINFEKDDIYLSVIDIVTRKKGTYKLEKPNLDRLVGPNFIKAKEALGFKLVVNYDETIDLVTKSISKDYTKTILYKTRFSDEGKKLNEISFELNLQDKTFLYSLNKGGGMKRLANSPDVFRDDLSINNYYEDTKNGDIYIYGLYGDNKIENLNSNAKPLGYYVFKFDKLGNKIWESINPIQHKEFNTGHIMSKVYVSLEQLNGDLCFIVGIELVKDYLSYGIVEKTSGKEIKKNIMFVSKFSSRINDAAKFDDSNILYKGIKELKGGFFNYIGLIALDVNPKFSDYVKTKITKNDLYFKAFFSDKGIWLTETDKDHYKVILFND